MQNESRTERKKREVRGRIVAAAAELFDQYGIEATKVETICERADIALRTFFNHFPNKRDVVDQLAIDATGQVAARIRAVHEKGSSTRDRLERFFEESIEVSLRGGPTHRDLLSALITVPVGTENLQAAHSAMVDLLGDGVLAGDVVEGVAAETLADAVIGTFYRIIVDWTHQEGYPLRDRLEEACRFLCDSIAPQTA